MLVELYYDTYESFSYADQSRPLEKRAIIYLPYGYLENNRYNVIYMMHGGWSNETTILGTPTRPSSFKNVIDNAIQDGIFEPLILVCPTYNNTNDNGQDSDNYSLALQLTRNYHNELVNDLIPAVEGKFSSYAESTDMKDLIASRDHRAFMGFSMGSVATWRTFEYCLDYFRYFFRRAVRLLQVVIIWIISSSSRVTAKMISSFGVCQERTILLILDLQIR